MFTDFTVFNFSGVYEEESFYQIDKGSSFCCQMLDFKDIPGTNCMCDDMARKEITKRLMAVSKDDGNSFAKGVHFIDSGNYHYMSAIMLDMLKEPFSLIVLDHHPDMQPPMFGDILSCGGWVLDVLNNNPFVRDVHIIGADKKLIEKLEEADVKRVKFYGIEDVIKVDESENKKFSINIPETAFPVYLSLDKDVIRRDELVTNWDQGEATIEQIFSFMKELLHSRDVIGFDICGECAFDPEDCDVEAAIIGNDMFNKEMLQILKG